MATKMRPTAPGAVELIIDSMAVGDLGGVAQIHAASFDEAWSASMIGRILGMSGACGIVSRRAAGAPPIGLALSRVAAEECELLSLAVDPAWRGGGIGGLLLDAAMGWAAGLGARHFFLEVAEDNAAARHLYDCRGLKVVGRRRGYYRLKSGATTDALTMRAELPPVPPPA